MKHGTFFTVVATAVLLAACTYAEPNPPNKLTPEGAKVKVAENGAQVVKCRSLGQLTGHAASVFGKVDIVADETVDAQNKTATMGGNTVVKRDNPAGVNVPGAQEFEAFLCE